MSLVNITVENAALKAALTRLVSKLRDTTPIMHSLSEIMVDASQRAFINNVDPATGAAWAPLSKSRQRQRQKNGRSPTSNLLQDTQQLVNSITGNSGNSIHEVGPNFARVGTNLEYAAAHQFGATIQRKSGAMTVRLRKKSGRWQFAKNKHKRVRTVETTRKAYTINIPARPFLGVNQTDIDDMVALIARRLAVAIAGSAA